MTSRWMNEHPERKRGGQAQWVGEDNGNTSWSCYSQDVGYNGVMEEEDLVWKGESWGGRIGDRLRNLGHQP